MWQNFARNIGEETQFTQIEFKATLWRYKDFNFSLLKRMQWDFVVLKYSWNGRHCRTLTRSIEENAKYGETCTL